MSKDLRFNLEDVSQIIIGSFALAIPISFSEEAWRLSETLPFFNLSLLLLLSFCFLGFYTFQSIFQGAVKHRLFAFVFRVFIAYLIATVVVFLILLAIDKLPLIDETVIAIKRIIVISMPASMGAIIVDGFDKE
ncbi:DUF2391 family protein [Halarcobacter sp.]|uniref:DUF2391 family protein n=1 Tax=Halarcobacter sp. TaxID=2321133 RepID=UPI0029F49068|nr:DUF2391 family protein [Halarcobacter sp.]